MGFGTLALIVAAGLLGPMLGGLGAGAPPIVVGEIAAGVIIGPTGLGWIHPSDPALVLLSSVGFALLMFVVGTHLPVRSPELRPALGHGLMATVVAGALAIGAGFGLSPFLGLDRPFVLAVLMATSSAAVALPVLQSIPRTDSAALVTTAWIAIADVVTVLAIPLVLPAGSTLRALEGGTLVIAAATLVLLGIRSIRGTELVERVRKASVERGWGVDLRIALLLLFALSWIADRFGTSILLAGFAGGVAVALLDEPRRVAQQLIGIGEGFFIPLFFTTLGARLDLGAFLREPRTIALGAALLVGTTVIHVATAMVLRLPVATGLLATAQLGVPAAVASVGLAVGVVDSAQASAVVGASVGSLIVCAVGGALLGHRGPLTDAVAPSHPSP